MNILDGLRNVVANLGTGRDKAASSVYVFEPMQYHDLDAAYRGSWLPRAIVDIPATDATRKWRQWKGEADQIEAIEALEKSLRVRDRVAGCMKAARLYGGAAIYIATGERNPAIPLRPDRVREIRSLSVLTPRELTPGPINQDIENPYFGKPETYKLARRDGQDEVVIHSSRLIVMTGNDTLGFSISYVHQGWGDSVLQSSLDAIMQMDSTSANVASLVFEAKVDVFKFDGLSKMFASGGGDRLVTERLSTQAAMKGINGAVVIDALDDYQAKSASFSGLDALMDRFGNLVAGASGIPVTRLFGRASSGLSGSGDGDERVYYDRIGYVQSAEIEPAMSVFDECLINAAIGSRPPEIWYEWRALRQVTEKERAEIFKNTADAARALAGAQSGELIPIDALSDSLVNELVEQGVLPGLDQAIEEFGSLSEQNDLPGDVPEMGTGDPDAQDIA